MFTELANSLETASATGFNEALTAIGPGLEAAAEQIRRVILGATSMAVSFSALAVSTVLNALFALRSNCY